MKSSQSLTRKQIFVPELGEVTIRIYEGQKQAIMRQSSFVVTACGKDTKEAIESLKKNYENLKNLMQNSD